MKINLDNKLIEDTIKNDINNEPKFLDEDGTVGTSDEGDNNPSDTTSAEAEEQADEGEEILKRMRDGNKGEDF